MFKREVPGESGEELHSILPQLIESLENVTARRLEIEKRARTYRDDRAVTGRTNNVASTQRVANASGGALFDVCFLKEKERQVCWLTKKPTPI